jgi:GrpB-like predicted nucleotidyltransferase (UPF0157 family)
LLVAIHHVGSTAIPRLAAKPIIDMLPEVSDISKVDALNPLMEEQGYEAMGEYGLPGRRYFRRLEGQRHLVQLHTYESGDPEILRHLSFRDYIRAHPKISAEYAGLKISLAQQFSHSSQDYQDGKQAWIQATEQAALKWQMSL